MSFIVDWYSDGPLAAIALVIAGLFVFAGVLRGVSRKTVLYSLMPWAIGWHLAIFLFNIFWLLPFYGAESDALSYHNDGVEIADAIRQGAWGTLDWGLSTKAMSLIAGFMYAPFGANIYGMQFFSAMLGLCGAIYLCRAFGLWVPVPEARRYCLIILFMPSIVMWTSLFGKDSWLALGLGLTVFGYSSMQRSGATGIPHFIVGMVIMIVLRPHIALAIGGSMASAYIWGFTTSAAGNLPVRIVRVVVLVALLGFLLKTAGTFMNVGDLSVDNVDDFMRQNSENLAKAGGSVVEVQVAPGVLGMISAFPRGVIRVLLEPFPWEVHNFNAGLAALENIFIGWFLISHLKRLRKLIGNLVRVPFFLFCGFAAFLLLLMFSFVPNLGLLSRERAQLLPFWFAVLVASEVTRLAKPGTWTRMRVGRAVHASAPQPIHGLR